MARLDDDRRNNPFAAPGSDFDQDLADPDLYPEGHGGPLVYGTFVRRLGAFLIDHSIAVFLSAVIFIFIGIVFDLDYVNPDEGHDQKRLDFLFALVDSFVTLLYFSILESSTKQATLGKRLLGLKVVDLQGNRISHRRATGRFLGKFLSCFFFYLGYLVQPFTQRKQAWHDSLAGTLVVKA